MPKKKGSQPRPPGLTDRSTAARGQRGGYEQRAGRRSSSRALRRQAAGSQRGGSGRNR